MPQGDPPKDLPGDPLRGPGLAMSKLKENWMAPSISREKRDDDHSVKICERIIAIYELLEKHKDRPSIAMDHTDVWTKFAEENRVTFDDGVLKNHRYLNEIKNLKSSNTKGRLVTIGKEVATMTTSLPPGIFVKVSGGIILQF
jgi:hypothetical protein